MESLNEKKCIPCSGGVPPLSNEEKSKFKTQISPEWTLTHDDTRLHRSFKFKDFAKAMDLAKKIGVMADEQWHHPELGVGA